MGLHGVPMMVVLVTEEQLIEPASAHLVFQLQKRFHIPVMLVARKDEFWTDASAYSKFGVQPYLTELVFIRDQDLEWNQLREQPEEELPF